MSLKIIAGEYRGRVLRSVKGFQTRPLLGQVREAIFNVLGERTGDAEVWDLFAGTGASGLEALSRGAARVIFVEKTRQAIGVLRENLTTLGDTARERSHVLRGDAWDPAPMTPWGEAEEIAPDVVFFDPPYKMVGEDPAKAVWRAQRIAERLAPGGVMVFHFQDGHLDEDDFDRPVELRRWGRSCVAFLERDGERPQRERIARAPDDDPDRDDGDDDERSGRDDDERGGAYDDLPEATLRDDAADDDYDETGSTDDFDESDDPADRAADDDDDVPF